MIFQKIIIYHVPVFSLPHKGESYLTPNRNRVWLHTGSIYWHRNPSSHFIPELLFDLSRNHADFFKKTIFFSVSWGCIVERSTFSNRCSKTSFLSREYSANFDHSRHSRVELRERRVLRIKMQNHVYNKPRKITSFSLEKFENHLSRVSQKFLRLRYFPIRARLLATALCIIRFSDRGELCVAYCANFFFRIADAKIDSASTNCKYHRGCEKNCFRCEYSRVIMRKHRF